MARIRLFLSSKPSFNTIFTPFKKIMAKTVITAPPITQLGIALKIAPILGNKPASIRTMAPIAIQNRLITLVIAMIPTFWPKAVFGRTLKMPANAQLTASDIIPPEISSAVASRPKAEIVIPFAFPMVSRPATTYTAKKGKTISERNRGLIINGIGTLNHAALETVPKLTIPIRAATM